MKNTSLFRNILLVALCLILTACSTPRRAKAPAAPVVEIVIQSTSEPPTSEPSVTPPPTAPEATAQAPASTLTPEAIAHQFIPRLPVYTNYLPGECNTGFNFQQGTFKVRQPCDVWDTNLLERPVSADLKTFYHYLDILTAQVGSDGDWYYASLNLFGAGIPEDKSAFSYFFEIDLDQNGRGDLLVAVDNLDLYMSEWTVTGVRVWRDLNGDVGGTDRCAPRYANREWLRNPAF